MPTWRCKISLLKLKNNLLLTERKDHTMEYWPEVVTVRTECSEVCTKMTKGQYSPVRLEQARLASSLFYGMLSLNLPATKTKNTQLMTVSMEMVKYGKILTKNQSECLDFPQDYHAIVLIINN